MSRVQAIEHQIYPTAADWFGQGRLKFHNGEAVLDGKRLEGPVVQDYA
jgi:folate-dependent phosphoribosylglycinamide formyltransferase PurN